MFVGSFTRWKLDESNQNQLTDELFEARVRSINVLLFPSEVSSRLLHHNTPNEKGPSGMASVVQRIPFEVIDSKKKKLFWSILENVPGMKMK